MTKPFSLIVAGMILATTTIVSAEEIVSTTGVTRISDLGQSVGYAKIDTAQNILPTTCNSVFDAAAKDGKVPMLQQWGAYPLSDSCCNASPAYVTYKDIDEMHPAAKPMTVWVLDPHYKDCNCTQRKLVPIQICVPPCSIPEIKVKKDGARVTYQYGRYGVAIRVYDDFVEVDYQND